jgi:phage-related protein
MLTNSDKLKLCIFSYHNPIKLKSKEKKNPDIQNLIEEKVGTNLKHISTGGKFLNRTPMAYALRSRINKWDLIKLKSFCKAKDTINRIKWQPTDWKKIFTNPTSSQGLISNICKEIKKLRLQRTK